jgi:hypothetical protein
VIKLIGGRRVFFLGILLVLNLVVVAGYFAGLSPMMDDARSQLNTVNGEISDLQAKIQSIKEDITYVHDNTPRYEALQQKGFFKAQDRFMIERTLEDLRAATGITGFAFTVGAVAQISNADADSIGQKLVNSRITISKIISPLEPNIYAFMQKISEAFPEYARIQSLELRRMEEVNEVNLKKIASGETVNFVDATAIFDWMTLVPKDVAPSPAAGGGADAAGFRGR